MRGGLWTLGRREGERERKNKSSPSEEETSCKESSCLLLIIDQCLITVDSCCVSQAFACVTESMFRGPAEGQTPSSGPTRRSSLVHQWLVIGDTAGPEASRTAKCFFLVKKNKLNSVKKQNKTENTFVLLFLFFLVFSIIFFPYGFINHFFSFPLFIWGKASV